MATPEQIRKGLQDLASRFGPRVSNIAIVKSVDESKHTCVLIDEDDQEFLDVRLKPVLTANQSFILIPKIGTHVLAVRVEDDDDWMVIVAEEVSKFLWKTETTDVEFSDKLKFEANGTNMLSLLERLFVVIERGYQTNNGPTVQLILEPEFASIKNDFKKLLK